MTPSPAPDRKATVLLMLAIAGGVDAIGLAETGRYFVSFMSGNVTQIGLQLAYRDGAGALLPLGLVALFVAGATIGSLIAERTARRGAAALLLAEAALLGVAWAGLDGARPGLGVAALAVAMGVASIVMLHDAAIASQGHATGVLVRLGVALAGLGRDVPGRTAGFHAAAVAALMLGSMGGALGRLRFGSAVLLLPIAALALLGLAALGDRARPADRSASD